MNILLTWLNSIDGQFVYDYIDWNLIEITFYSLVCGSLFGFERQKRNSSTGIRTNIFLCLASALYAYLGTKVPGANDTSRVMAQIVSGMGFIGAGVIWTSPANNRTVGVTTAVLLWLVAAIGIAIALGKGKEAIGFSILVYVINIITYKYERFTYKQKRIKREKSRKKECIKMAPRVYQLAIEGKKTATTRRGYRKINIGEHFMVSNDDLSEKTKIVVKKVESKKYKEIDDKLANKENYQTAKELKDSLKVYYPDIKDNDPITIIHFRLKD